MSLDKLRVYFHKITWIVSLLGNYETKKIKRLHEGNIELEDLKYTTKRGKYHGFSRYSLAVVILSIEDVDKEQSDLCNRLSGIKRGKISVE